MTHRTRFGLIAVTVVGWWMGLSGQAWAVPDDPQVVSQPYLGDLTQTFEANAYSTGTDSVTGESMVIAIIGDGVDLTHPDLDGKGVGQPWDFIEGHANPTVSGPLATEMAGIAAAKTNNSIGIDGVCPDCVIHNIRADTENVAQLRQAIDYAVQQIQNHRSNKQGVILIASRNDDNGDNELAFDQSL